jgi:hypothetical protein
MPLDPTSRVVAFPLYKLNDIPEALRAMANRIECGEINAERIVVAIESNEGECSYAAFGAEPFTKAYAVGILQGAMIGILRPFED